MAEDPIEYAISGATQVQLLKEKNQTFQALIRTFMRQDPDIITCSEIRDEGTASAVCDAAVSGILVLAGIHATNAAEALARIAAMRIPAHKLVALKGGLVAQQLMRRNCTECSSTRPLREEEVDLTRLPISTPVRDANCLTAAEKETRLRDGSLCSKCHGSGYKGRVAVYEVLPFTDEVKTRLISLSESFSVDHYRALADVNSMVRVGMLDYGRALVRDGITTVSELEKLSNALYPTTCNYSGI